MSAEISRAEVQLCMAAKNIRKAPFTPDELRAFGGLAFKDALEDWSGEFERFCRRNLLRAEGDRYSLTDEGQTHVEKVIASEFFGKMLLRAEQSQAFARFCERVYGKNLTQFGTADMEQLDKLISVLSLTERDHALDAGCGIGTFTEYLADLTGAKTTGIDSAEPAISRAAERAKHKADRLHFLTGDLNQIEFPPATFDAVISVDTLYFSKDLNKTVGQMKAVLKAGGQMGLFYSEVLGPDAPAEQLAADRTKLARALKANDLSFTAYDLTESNVRFWQRSTQVAEEMQAEFAAEGNPDLCEGRITEGGAVLALAASGRMSRHLYHVKLL